MTTSQVSGETRGRTMAVLELAERTGPDALRASTRPTPTAPDDGVVIDVEAIGINFPDLLATLGQYQHAPPLPSVPGCEVAGTVSAAGPGSRFDVGDRVAAFVWDGGYAEEVAAPDRQVMRVPAGVPWTVAAGLVVNYQTVHFALRRRGGLVPGETVLVMGAAGGIGSAALQLGLALGARVVAGVADDEQEATARSAGAVEVIRLDEGFAAHLRELTGGRGVDVVLDPLGGRFFDEAVRGLAALGRVLVVGFAAGEIPNVKVNRLLLRNASVVGVAWGAFLAEDPTVVHEAGAELTGLLAAGSIRPHVHEVVPFAEVPLALQRLSRGQVRGKAVALAPGGANG